MTSTTGNQTAEPFNCPRCGAHDYGLYAAAFLGCPHCLRSDREALLSLAKQYASECMECNGTGRSMPLNDAGFTTGSINCEACADIRAVIGKVEDRVVDVCPHCQLEKCGCDDPRAFV